MLASKRTWSYALLPLVFALGCGSSEDAPNDGSGAGSGENPESPPSESESPTAACEGDAWCESLVNEHNAIREAVNEGAYFGQPKAEPPIPLVVWDPKIAEKAQAYADTISDFSQGHSSSEYRTYASSHHDGYHGENMAIGGGSYEDPEYFVAEGWGSSEAQGCQLASCGGHYTQIVWRETIAIGCGRKENVAFGGGSTGTLTVCQYAPGGNVNGRDPY